MAYRIVIDPGHGGEDFGATYNGRNEKDDNLNLALAVGRILADNGIDVLYTRTEDVYNTPFEKATMGNNANADLFLSIHRNALPTPNTGTGVETLVYNDQGIKSRLARNINSELGNLGFDVRGVIERPNLVVLKRTKMPAVLVEAGFINNDADNEKFDAEFNEIAQAIADGILNTVG
ncbi:MAG: N-acetylmuramoyl-L-alanine amidase [Lachnospiraceae bacterium]|nr:N-acetylmuramoyl-L-alanine amidase [Lachnospiraceae bacterium]